MKIAQLRLENDLREESLAAEKEKQKALSQSLEQHRIKLEQQRRDLDERKSENDALAKTSINKKLRIKELLKELEKNQEMLRDLQVIAARRQAAEITTEMDNPPTSSRTQSVVARNRNDCSRPEDSKASGGLDSFI